MKSTNPEALMQNEQAKCDNHQVDITATIARFPTADDCNFIASDTTRALNYLSNLSRYFDGKPNGLTLHHVGDYEDGKFIPKNIVVGFPDEYNGIVLPVEWFNIEGDI